MARPASAQAAIDKDELEKLMKLCPSRKEAADWFSVSESSLERFIKKNFRMSFDALRDKSFVKTKIAIKRAQIDKALKGDNTMLIWCGKQHLGQADKMDQNTKNQVTVENKTRTIEQVRAELSELELLRAKQGK